MKLFNKNECVNICPQNTNKYVCLAVGNMRNDFKRISEKRVIPKYIELCFGFEKLAESLSYPLKKHVEVKWLLFSKTFFYIYKWYVYLYEAKQYCDLYESEKMKASLNAARRSLEEYLRYRKCAEYGIFENWYRGD